MDLVLQPGVAPTDAPLPDSAQALLNFVAAYVQLQGLESFNGVVISATVPVSSDRDKVWAKKDPGSDRVIGLYVFKGTWTPIPIVVATGETDPANPAKGELFFNTKVNALKFYNGSIWSTNTFQTGTTASRPTGVPVNYLYFDTDIGRLLRFTTAGWTTFDGGVGDVKIVSGVTEDAALLRNPGWLVYAAMSGRFPVGAEADNFPADQEGGSSTVAWSAKGTSAAGGSRESPAIGSISIDGKEISGKAGLGNTPTSLDSGEINILPPYKSVLFLRKEF